MYLFNDININLKIFIYLIDFVIILFYIFINNYKRMCFLSY